MAGKNNKKTITELYDFLGKNMVTKTEHKKTTTELYDFLGKNMVTKTEHEKTTIELYEFLQEHMVTREEFQDFRKETNSKIGELKTELKDFIDDRLANLRGDIIVLMRKEDTKLLYLIKLLKDKKILEDKEVRKLIKMEPFPKVTVEI